MGGSINLIPIEAVSLVAVRNQDMKYLKEIDIVECEQVYPPKEDTFLLLEHLALDPGERVLEMGCGTGLISCHISRAGGDLSAVDVNPAAVSCTRNNLLRNQLPGCVSESDLFARVEGRFELIVFNPPYLAVEEKEGGMLQRAWAGGRTGLDVLAQFLSQVRDRLTPEGRVLLLLSSEMEAGGLATLLSAFSHRRMGSRRYFFEELWVEELRVLQS